MRHKLAHSISGQFFFLFSFFFLNSHRPFLMFRSVKISFEGCVKSALDPLCILHSSIICFTCRMADFFWYMSELWY